jgi:hypothetical protein
MLSPQEFGAVLADEMRLWQAVVQETGAWIGLAAAAIGALMRS